MLKINVTPKLFDDRMNRRHESPVKLLIQCRLGRTKKSTGITLKKSQWDAEGKKVKNTHRLAPLLNQSILNQVNDIQKKVMEAELTGKKLTMPLIKRIIHGEKFSTNLFEFTEKLVKELEGKYSQVTIDIYSNEINRLKKYAGEGLQFDDITPAWLRKYENYLRAKGLHENTIHKCWKVLKKFFNMARRDKLITEYPFSEYDNPKYRQTDRTWLSLEEVKMFEDALKKPLPEYLVVTGYYFLLGCYSGLRFSDWQRFNDRFVNEERLILRAKKNGELVSMKIHHLLARVIEKLKAMPPIYSEAKTNEYLKAIAKIAGIEKHITTHVARHSFAVRCAELGISIETTAELMGITVKACGYYYKVTRRKIDDEFSKWNVLAEVV